MATKKRKPGARALANRKRKLAAIKRMSEREKRELYPLRALTRKELEELTGEPSRTKTYWGEARWPGHAKEMGKKGPRIVPRGAKNVTRSGLSLPSKIGENWKSHSRKYGYASQLSWEAPEEVSALKLRAGIGTSGQKYKSLRGRQKYYSGWEPGERIPVFASAAFLNAMQYYWHGQGDPLYKLHGRFMKARPRNKSGRNIIEVSHSDFHALCDYAREARRSRAQGMKGAAEGARAFLKRYKKYC